MIEFAAVALVVGWSSMQTHHIAAERENVAGCGPAEGDQSSGKNPGTLLGQCDLPPVFPECQK